MPSFRISLTPSRREAGRYVAYVRQRLQKAFADNPDVSQSQVADAIGVHRSVITRQLHGRQDLGLARVAEIAAVLGYRPQFDLVKINPPAGSNFQLQPPSGSYGDVEIKAEVRSANAVVRRELEGAAG